MRQFSNLARATLAVAALWLGGSAASPALAAAGPSDFDAAVPCDAFQRSGSGTWTAIAPVTLHIDNGMVMTFKPGAVMVPNSTINGVAIPVILNRQCGNR